MHRAVPNPPTHPPSPQRIIQPEMTVVRMLSYLDVEEEKSLVGHPNPTDLSTWLPFPSFTVLDQFVHSAIPIDCMTLVTASGKTGDGIGGCFSSGTISIRVQVELTVSCFPFRFWLAVQDLKKQPLQDVAKRVEEIWQEFLAPGAPSAINLDSHSYEITSQNVKDGGRYTFEDAQVCLSTQMVRLQSVSLSTSPLQPVTQVQGIIRSWNFRFYYL